GWFSKHDEEKSQFKSKHGNPSEHNVQLGVVKDIPIAAYSGIGFYADRTAAGLARPLQASAPHQREGSLTPYGCYTVQQARYTTNLQWNPPASKPRPYY
ncbi:hypothetical protein AVEN_44074-1, partial [Araneus ventricosus]